MLSAHGNGPDEHFIKPTIDQADPKRGKCKQISPLMKNMTVMRIFDQDTLRLFKLAQHASY